MRRSKLSLRSAILLAFLEKLLLLFPDSEQV